MKRIAAIFGLMLCAAALQAQTTIIVGTTIVGGDGVTPIGTGKLIWQPTDLNGNALNVNLGSTHGLMVPRSAVCLISNGQVTANINGGSCTTLNTAVTNPASFCYRLTIQDTVNNWSAPTMPCVQPYGASWDLDYYVPPGSITAPVLNYLPLSGGIMGGILEAPFDVDLVSSSLGEELPNNTASGATLNKLVCGAAISATLEAQTCTTASANWTGVAVGGATGSTAGNVQIARLGDAALLMDGAASIGDYVQISTTTAGDGHDAGSTFPSSGVVIGRLVTATSGAGQTATVNLYSPGVGSPGTAFGGGAGDGISGSTGQYGKLNSSSTLVGVSASTVLSDIGGVGLNPGATQSVVQPQGTVLATNSFRNTGLWGKHQSATFLGNSIVNGCCRVQYAVNHVARASGTATVTFTVPTCVDVPPAGALTTIAGTATGSGSFNTSLAPVTASSCSGTTATVSYLQAGSPDVGSTSDSGTEQSADFVQLLGSWYGLSATNLGFSGTTIADDMREVYAQSVSASGGQLFGLQEGTNTLSISSAGSNGSAILPYYEAAELAAAYFLTQADQTTAGMNGKVKASVACAGVSGWSASTYADPWVPSGGLSPWAFQMQSSTNGAHCGAQVFGSTVGVLYTLSGASGATADVLVDGSIIGSLSTTAPYSNSGSLPLASTGCSASGTAPARSVTCTYTGTPGPTATGQVMAVQGQSDPTYNGTQFYVTSFGSGTVSFINNLASGSSSTGGTLGVNLISLSSATYGSASLPQIFQITGLSEKSHTVAVTVTNGGAGNPFYLDGFVGNEGANQPGSPTFLQFGTPRSLNPNLPESLTSLFEQGDRYVATTAWSQGLPVAYVGNAASIGTSPGGSLFNFMYPDVTDSCTVTSGSNTLTSCSTTSGFVAGDFISDLGASIPANATVSSAGSGSIVLAVPVASVSIATAGSGQTDVADVTLDSTGGGCTTAARIEYQISGGALIWVHLIKGREGLNCTSAPSWTFPAVGTPGTLTVTLAAPTATLTENVFVYNPGVHPNGAGHYLEALAAAAADTVARAPNQQQPQGVAVPINGTTGTFTGALKSVGLSVTGGTCISFGVATCKASADTVSIQAASGSSGVRIYNNNAAESFLTIQSGNGFAPVISESYSGSSQVANWQMGPNGATYWELLDAFTGGSPVPVIVKQGAPSYTLYLDSTGKVGLGTNGPTWQLSVGANAGGMDSNGIIHGQIGTSLASASTIAPVSPIVHVTGTTTINTITAPAGCATSGYGCYVILVPDGLWSTGTSGNIAIAGTAVVGNAITETYDPATSKWYPSTTGASGTATTATNLSGGATGSAPYQSGSGATAFIASPTTSGHTFVYSWAPSGSPVNPTALDLATWAASPPAWGGTAPAAGSFSSLSVTGAISTGASPPTACGSATGCGAFTEAGTAGTPTASQDYFRADSTAHGFKVSLNGGGEFTSLMNFSTVALGSTSPGGVSGTLAVANGGTGTGSTLTGLMRGNSSAMTASELSGDATTSGSNAVTVVKVNGGSVPASANLIGTNGSSQPISEETDLGTITYNASGTTTFAAASAFIAGGVVTATHSTSTTFSPTGLIKWGSYTVEIKQDSTGGGTTFTLGTGGTCSAWKIGGGGAGAITLSTAASAIDVLAFTYDGTNCIANFRTNFN